MLGRRRLELLLQMGIEMFRPVRFPNILRWKGDQILQEKEEGGQRVFLHLSPCPSPPFPGAGIKGTNRLFREKGDQPFRLSLAIFPISPAQIRILPDHSP